ncbi:hypothetical protein EPR50_G00057950 [Perca flavescens]|uniref:Alpha-macroglobulin-like TED domain-containing protein n=1 Tax=Perca flavescens TaxID=8167 RepID=A0A484D793_PERFV|nr:hypothetical protein EPR50_G00057950 [Perca flavescens]
MGFLRRVAGVSLRDRVRSSVIREELGESRCSLRRKEPVEVVRASGYQNELNYRKKDGSFAVWEWSESSTWLTAYVAKVFAMADNLVAVPKEHICEAIKFLILRAQQPDGLFQEVGTVILGGMISLPGSIDKAVNYLERRLPRLTNPYAVAMTSYALANENKLNKEILYKFASPDGSHWRIPQGHIYTLEATAYALLALVKAEAFEEARPVVRWFNKQQKVGGGFGSTQATIMVYQAIAEYWTSAKEPEYNLSVDIFIEGKSKPDKFNFNRDNHYATRTSKVRKLTNTHALSGSLISSFLMFSGCSAGDGNRVALQHAVHMPPRATDP